MKNPKQTSFIQSPRLWLEEEVELFKQRPTALLLLLLIAKRAKRHLDHPNKLLDVGEAYIGDWQSYTHSRRCYRSDIDFLCKHQKTTIKTTNKGTIAKLISTSPFNINAVTSGQQGDQRAASKRPLTKNVINNKDTVGVNILNTFNKSCGTKFKTLSATNLAHWLKIYSQDEINCAINNIPRHKFWAGKMTPTILFRQKNPKGEPVDYIGDLLNQPKEKPNLLEVVRKKNEVHS